MTDRSIANDIQRCKCGMGGCDGESALHLIRLEGQGETQRLAQVASRDQRAARLTDLKLDVEEREYTRRLAKVDDTPDTTTSTTLTDLIGVFGDTIDLSPTPSILDRRHGDGGLVLPAGKISWLYGHPGSGKSFIGEIAAYESILRGGRAIYLDYEDQLKTFHQRGAILGFNPKVYADFFWYIRGGLADHAHLMPEALEFLNGAPDPIHELDCGGRRRVERLRARRRQGKRVAG